MFKRLKNFTISVYQNYFEIAACLGASLIIILAIFMDYILGLQACPMCMMTRYLFGVISVIGQSHPFEFSSLVNHALDGDFMKAKVFHDQLDSYYHYLYSEGNPSGVKALLSLQGICENNLRLPLVPISNNLFEDLKIFLDNEIN